MSLVLDSSAALAWIYVEETSPAVVAVLDRVAAGGAWVPGLWRLEIANILETGIRRGRNNADFRDATLLDFGKLMIQIDPETNEHAWGATLLLAARHGLTTYNAAYLELALRRRLPLASLDRKLRAAAAAEHVGLLGV